MINKSTLILLSALLSIFICINNPSYALEIDDLDSYLYPESEKTISMNFTGATLENVLKIFSQQSGLNFIVATDVASITVNLYLDNVPINKALERILSAHNLTYEIDPGSNIFIVNTLQATPNQLMTRVYPLKFASVPSSQLLNTLSITSEGGGGEDSSSGGILDVIKAVLSPKGVVVEDARTNSLMVSDIPSQFPLIESTITRLDVRIPLILIEVELLDITKSTADDMGVKFGSVSFANFVPASRTLSYPFNPHKITDDPLRTVTGPPLKQYTAGTLSFPALAMTLDFLRSRTDTKNLARPRILTLNNHTAEISITTDEAIGLASSTTSSEGTATSVAEAERVQTGVSLRVTPQANVVTREIIMAIEPKVIQVTVGESFGGQNFLDPEERGTKSILRVSDGDTIVLGGLLRTEITNVTTSIPILGSIPIIGAPFRHKDTFESQRELIIFITPHILDENTPLMAASTKPRKIVREQSIPSSRAREIEKDLSYMEKKYFNAY